MTEPKQQSKINTIQLACTFAGCFLGAGFVSGQELWQFFGRFGFKSIPSLIIAVVIIVYLGIIIMRLAVQSHTTEIDRIIFSRDNVWLRMLVIVAQQIFLLGVISIMYAGGGAILYQSFGLPVWLGNALIYMCSVLVALRGIYGVISVFSFMVPLLGVITMLLGCKTVFFCSRENISNFLIPNVKTTGLPWWISSLAYVCYNIFGNMGIIAAIGTTTFEDRKLKKGGILGGIILSVIAVNVLTSIFFHPEAVDQELPMLMVAHVINPLGGKVYGFLLLWGMLGTSISYLVCSSAYWSSKSYKLAANPRISVVLLGFICFLASLGGFGDLISIIYPIFGCGSSVFILCMVAHYLQIKVGPKCNTFTK